MTSNRTDDLVFALADWKRRGNEPGWEIVDRIVGMLREADRRGDNFETVIASHGAEVERLTRKLADAVYACEDNWGKWKRAEAALAREQAVHTQVPPGPDSTFRAWDFGRKLS